MSDSEEETSTARNRVLKYQCPPDFVAFSYDSSASALRDGDEQELWLIKAPARFDPKCFENLKVPLSGLEMVRSCGTTPQIYSVLSSRTPSDLHLLVSKGKNQKPSLCSSGFSGVLKISESYGNCSENQTPVPVPAAAAPSIPDGLKQRFQPFGSSSAAHMEEEVNAVSPKAPKRSIHEPNDGEERKKKKKKKKKDKRQEESEAVFIKQEETQISCDQLELSELKDDEPTEERRRKKKKVKKEKERESEDVVESSIISKTEPLDPSYDYSETPTKTKKKKKKSSRNE